MRTGFIWRQSEPLSPLTVRMLDHTDRDDLPSDNRCIISQVNCRLLDLAPRAVAERENEQTWKLNVLQAPLSFGRLRTAAESNIHKIIRLQSILSSTLGRDGGKMDSFNVTQMPIQPLHRFTHVVRRIRRIAKGWAMCSPGDAQELYRDACTP